MANPGTMADPPDNIQLVHLSDPHLTSLQGIKWHELTNKRILGYLSWLTRRNRLHKSSILKALLEDLQVHRPDHIVITGDLTQIGTSREYQEARRWLAGLGPPDKVTIIPGNHDRYVRTKWRETMYHWLPYLQDDAQVEPSCLFPILRYRGPVAIVGMSSAVPTLPFMATGSLGSAQLLRLDTLLADLADRDMFRIVLIHHGPLPGTYSYRRSLMDRDDLISILEHRGAELVLHGHGHNNTEGIIRTKAADIPVFGVASASVVSSSNRKNATYNLFSISRQHPGWRINLCVRTYSPATGGFVTVVSKEISSEHI